MGAILICSFFHFSFLHDGISNGWTWRGPSTCDIDSVSSGPFARWHVKCKRRGFACTLSGAGVMASSDGIAVNRVHECRPAWDRSKARTSGCTAGIRTCSWKERWLSSIFSPRTFFCLIAVLLQTQKQWPSLRLKCLHQRLPLVRRHQENPRSGAGRGRFGRMRAR